MRLRLFRLKILLIVPLLLLVSCSGIGVVEPAGPLVRMRMEGMDNPDVGINFTVPVGGSYEIADLGTDVTVLRYFPDFGFSNTLGEVTNRSENPRNEAVEVEVTSEDASPIRIWLFKRLPYFRQRVSLPMRFIFLGIEEETANTGEAGA